MAKVKLVMDVRKSYAHVDGTCPLKISIHHRGKTRYCLLNVYAKQAHWRANESILLRGHPNHLDANVALAMSLKVAKDTLVKYSKLLDSLSCEQLRDYIREELDSKRLVPLTLVDPLSTREVDVIVEGGVQSIEFFGAASKYMLHARRIKFRSVKTLQGWEHAVKMFRRFWELAHPDLDTPQVQLKDMKHRHLDEFIAWHCSKLSPFTGNFNKYSGANVYCRGISSVIKHMVVFHELDKLQNNPFYDYNLRAPKFADPEKISLSDVKKVLGVEFDRGTKKWDQVNFAIVMFNGEGMNFKDLSRLRMKDVQGDQVKYIRSKNKQPMNFVTKGKAVEIFEYYMRRKERGGNEFVFPIVEEDSFGTDSEEREYSNALRYFNKTMNRLAKARLGPNRTASTYFYRKGTVQALAEVGGSFDDAQSMLRHKNPKVTLRYWSPVARERIESLTDKTAF